ncbi:MAG: diguanylate cyclase [Candidatus Thiodiazotropha sp.]
MISKTIRKGDSVIRWGGEEFIVILPTAGPEVAQASLRSHERFWDIQVHQNRFDL